MKSLATLFSLLIASTLALSSYAQIQTSSLPSAPLATRDGLDRDDVMDEIRVKIKRQENPKVILLPFESEWGAKQKTAATNTMRSILAKNNVQLIDRKISKTLRDELIAIEQGGLAVGSSYNLADFALKGEVRTLTTTRDYFNATYGDNGAVITPRRCVIGVKLNVGVTLLNMNPLSVEQDFVLEQNYKNSYNNVNSCNGISDDQDKIKAVIQVFENKKHIIGNLFTAKGYVIDHRTTKKMGRQKHLFKTHLKKAGVYKPGSKATIVTKVERTDALGTKSVEMLEGPNGKVAKTVGDDYVWIEFSKKKAPLVFLGDEVKIQQTCGFGCKFMQGVENATR